MTSDIPYESIIFDFDGTLADTFEAAKRLFNEMARDYEFLPIKEEEIPALRHLTANEFFKHHQIKRRQIPFLLAKGTKRLRSEIKEIQPIDGIREVLLLLQKREIKCGILTSNSVENVNIFLEHHGLKDLFLFVSSTSRLTGKAKHLRSIARTFSLNSQTMLYVGDEVRDIKASQKADIHIAAVTWGFNSTESLIERNPNYIIDHPSGLLALRPLNNA